MTAVQRQNIRRRTANDKLMAPSGLNDGTIRYFDIFRNDHNAVTRDIV